MENKLYGMDFKSFHANTDVCIRAATRPYGEEYYEYLWMYVDDILAISLDPKSILQDLQHMVTFKNDNIEVLDSYLGEIF